MAQREERIPHGVGCGEGNLQASTFTALLPCMQGGTLPSVPAAGTRQSIVEHQMQDVPGCDVAVVLLHVAMCV